MPFPPPWNLSLVRDEIVARINERGLPLGELPNVRDCGWVDWGCTLAMYELEEVNLADQLQTACVPPGYHFSPRRTTTPRNTYLVVVGYDNGAQVQSPGISPTKSLPSRLPYDSVDVDDLQVYITQLHLPFLLRRRLFPSSRPPVAPFSRSTMKLAPLLLPAVVSASAYAAVVARDDGVHVHTLETERRGYGDDYGTGNGDDQTFDITLFHINDVHAHLDRFRSSGTNCTDLTLGCYGGYASVKATVDFLRPQKENSLFLNIGDEFQVSLPILIRST